MDKNMEIMKNLIDDVGFMGNEDFISGEYYKVGLEWLSLSYKNDKGVSRPDLQRLPDQNRINAIKESLIKQSELTHYKVIIQTGILSIGILDGCRYILDGQHRLQAYRELKSPLKVMIQVWKFNNAEDMRQKFIEINQNEQVESYSLNENLQQKLAYDALIKYINEEYHHFIRPQTDTGNCYFPCIQIKAFKDILPHIPELKTANKDNIIEIFENYNTKCKKSIESSKDCKDNLKKFDSPTFKNLNKLLYINKDVQKIRKNLLKNNKDDKADISKADISKADISKNNKNDNSQASIKAEPNIKIIPSTTSQKNIQIKTYKSK